MRNNILIFALLLGITASACRKESSFEPESGRESQLYTFTCSLDPDTRLGIDGTGKTSWESGDQILFHGKWLGQSGSKYYSRTVTLAPSDISADGKTATVSLGALYNDTPRSGCASNIFAIYPADAVAVDNGAGSWRAIHPFNTTNRPLMVGCNKEVDGTSFSFINLCALISFSVSGDYDSYEFSGNNGETVGYDGYQAEVYWKSSGSLYSNLTKDGSPLASVSGPVTADGSTVNYICVPAGADLKSGFTIKLLKSGAVKKIAKTSNSVKLSRNQLLPLGDISGRLTDAETPDPGTGSLCRPEYLGKTPMICCYFTEYTSSSVFPTLEDVKLFTHINVGHARFVNPQTGDGGLVIKSPGPNYIKKLAAYKKDYPELKLLLFIGGWGKNADGFSEMAKDDAKRALFCSECVRLCNEYGLDGVDLDWEYPTYAAKTTLSDGSYYYNGADKADKKNFSVLVKELRAALGDKRIISFAASSDDYSSAEYIDYNGVLEWVDYINVMTYSMGDPNPSNPSKQKHNSPLYKSSRFANNRGGADCIEGYHNKQGIPYNRMNYGIGFYGHGDGSVYPSSVSYTIAREALEKGTASGKSVSGYNVRWWDDASKSCYLGDSSGVMYASYEDAESIGYRVAYLKSKGMLGCLIWEYREDDSAGTLRKALYSLMTE